MKAFAKNLAALGLGCALALVLLEGLLRIRNPFETRLRGNQIVLGAHKHYVFPNQHIEGLDEEIVHTKNSLGFRGPEPPPRGLSDRLSIIAVGGSTTECFYLSDGRTWPELLQKELRSGFKKLWVNNAGLNGHTTYGHLVLVHDHIARLHPKIVLYLVGANEVGNDFFTGSDEFENVRSSIHISSLRALSKSAAAYSEVASVSLNLYRYARARMLGLPHQRVDLQSREKRGYPEPRLDEILNQHRAMYLPAFEQRLRNLLVETRRDSIVPVLITQPMLAGDVIDDRTGVDLDSVMVDQYLGHTNWKLMQIYNDVTRKVAQEEQVYLIDLAVKLAKSSRYFYDFYHYTNDGAAEVARIVGEDLWPFLEKEFPGFVRRST